MAESKQARAWVNIPSNVITQNVLTVPALLDALAAEDVLPNNLLPLFMHEFTHHWCFNSSVGTALSLLRQRALRLLAADPSPLDSEAVRHLFYESVFRYLSAVRALMPLIEGIALFSEFNSLPGACRSISTPAIWATNLFVRSGPNEPRTTDPLISAWHRLARAHRTSAEGIGRKLLTLTAPLEGPGRGNYLRGYLALRALHRSVIDQSALFLDGDFFVMYMRHVFFNDHQLAILLLAREPSTQNWSKSFLTRLNQRIGCLRHDIRSQAAEFDELIASHSSDPENLELVTLVERGSVRRFREEFDRWIDDPAEGVLDEASLRTWRTMVPLHLAHRHLVRLALSKGTIRVDQNRQVWFDDKRLGPSISDAMSGEGEGIAVIYFLPESETLLLLVIKEGEVVRIGLGHPQSEEIRAAITAIRYVLDQEELIEGSVASLEDIPAWFTEMPEELAEIEQIAERGWINLALWDADESRREMCRKLMMRAGFGELLGRDARLVDGLATISAFSAAGVTYSELRSHLEEKGVDVDVIIRDLRHVEATTGLPLLGSKLTYDAADQLNCLV